MDLVHPQDRNRATKTFEHVIERNEDRQIEVRALIEDGTYGWHIARISPIVEDDVVVGAHILSYDVTDRKKTKQDLVRIERLRALGEMTAGINHNLNNILTGILGPASHLLQRLGDEQGREDADLIHQSAKRARDLIQRLDRSIKGSQEERQRVDVHRIIHKVLQASRPRWRDEAELRGVTIDLVTHLEKVPLVSATESGLHDILMNLIFNAFDALPGDGKIELTTRSEQDSVCVIVADTGIGMDEETQRRVFEPFFTTKIDIGTGLGLPTVYGTIASWGARIDLTSEPGRGTTFTLQLPLWEGSTKVSGNQEESKVLARKARVLVVDDEEIVRTVLETLLRSHHDVVTVRDRKAALDHQKKNKVDVALIDLGMPGLTGDIIASRMKVFDPSISTILLTGWSLSENDDRRQPFDFHLQKPIAQPDDLLETIGNAIRLRDRRAASSARGSLPPDDPLCRFSTCVSTPIQGERIVWRRFSTVIRMSLTDRESVSPLREC